MKAVSIARIKKELKHIGEDQHIELILALARFKKDNKELLTYLLFEAEDEDAYIELIKQEIDELFEEININHMYYVRKSTRKILRRIKKYIRYSKKKSTEAAVLMHFCFKLNEVKPSNPKSSQLENMFNRQRDLIEKAIGTLHADLQYDFRKELDELN
jgi:hypothetical protein